MRLICPLLTRYVVHEFMHFLFSSIHGSYSFDPAWYQILSFDKYIPFQHLTFNYPINTKHTWHPETWQICVIKYSHSLRLKYQFKYKYWVLSNHQQYTYQNLSILKHMIFFQISTDLTTWLPNYCYSYFKSLTPPNNINSANLVKV